MAPQTHIPLPATTLGTIGTIFWSVQLLPQIWYNHRQKSTSGLPGLMMFLWAISAIPFGIYAIVQNFNIPIQIQPQIFCLLSLVSWAQILLYNNNYSALKASAVAGGVGIVFAGVEVLGILVLRPLYERGVEWPITVVGVIAAILLAAGLLPPYWELGCWMGWVVGIHWGLLTVDWLGAFFSLMGVVAQERFDVLGGCLFIVCIVIEGGIFVSHGIWLFRTRHLRRAAKAAGKSFDDLPESGEYHVHVPRKGSIAASRDVGKVQVERRGSVALARDLERGSVEFGRVKAVSTVKEGEEVGFVVREEEVRGEGVERVDYGTIGGNGAVGRRNRPGYVRQDSNVVGAAAFKDPVW